VKASDYDELWHGIVRSPLAGAYIRELHSLATEVVRLAEEVFEAAPRPTASDSDCLRVDHAIMSKLFTLVGDAARISAMLSERPRRERSAREYEVHRRRVAGLRNEVLKNVRLERVFEAKVRHTLEHFDEYIDRTAVKYATGQIPTPSVAPIDLVVSRRRALERMPVRGRRPHVYYMRVFIASERVFINCGHEVSVQALRDECRRVAKRLAHYVPEPDEHGERGSSMLVIKPATFET
jgi:hypothetical protein